MNVLHAWPLGMPISDHQELCRAAITNMRGVKRFLARGRLEGPHTPPDASTAATWLKACFQMLWPNCRMNDCNVTP